MALVPFLSASGSDDGGENAESSADDIGGGWKLGVPEQCRLARGSAEEVWEVSKQLYIRADGI